MIPINVVQTIVISIVILVQVDRSRQDEYHSYTPVVHRPNISVPFAAPSKPLSSVGEEHHYHTYTPTVAQKPSTGVPYTVPQVATMEEDHHYHSYAPMMHVNFGSSDRPATKEEEDHHYHTYKPTTVNNRKQQPFAESNMSETSADLRQSAWLEWLGTIFRPTATTTPAPPTVKPQRDCPACTCGIINTKKRIVGGHETIEHQYPWMAMLLSNGEFYCGATLINDLYVVTAAHCLHGFNQRTLTIRLMEHNRINSSIHIVDRSVAWMNIHDHYSTSTFDSDIALIRLSEPVASKEMVRPVCLPARNNSFAGMKAITTGWGAVKEGGPVSENLQEVEVPILSQEACHKSKYGPKRITENMLCAGYDEGGKDSCQGDSGGPLHVIIADTKEYQLAGIVSWGEGCAKPHQPGVYTRVSQFIDWINKYTMDACKCNSPMKQTTGTSEQDRK